MRLRRYDATQGGSSLCDLSGPQVVKERPALQALFCIDEGHLSELDAPHLHKRPLALCEWPFFCYSVGVKRFELSASNSRSWRANRTALHPETLLKKATPYLFVLWAVQI